jgi:hypothetical protein
MDARLLMRYPRIFQPNLIVMAHPRMVASAWVCPDEHGNWWNRTCWSAVIIIERDLPFAISSLTG